MAHVTSALSVYDGQNPAVARSFEPRKIDSAQSLFAYKRSPTDGKDKWVQLAVQWSDSTAKRPTVRQQIDSTFPVLRTVDGVEVVVGIARAVTTFIVPDAMTEAEAQDFHTLHTKGCQNTSISVGVTKREPMFG